MITEDTVTFMDIGHLLQQAIHEGILSVTKQDHTASPPVSIEFPHSKTGVTPPQMPPAEEPEQPGTTVGVARSFPKTCMALHDMGLEQQDISAVLKSLASPKPSLFQRTLALSDGLRELRDGMCHTNPRPQPQNQWLAIGGEPEDVRSPSSSLERDSPINNQPQAPVAEVEVLPFGLTDQRILEDPSGGSEDSDLVMLDGQPASTTFRRREKHLLPAVDQEVQMAKRAKISTPGPFTGENQQLPQNSSHVSTHQNSSNLRIGPFERTKEPAQKHLDEVRADLKQPQDDLEHKNEHADFKDMPEKIVHQKSEIDRFERQLLADAWESEQSRTTGASKDKALLPSTDFRAESLQLSKRDAVEAFKPLPPPSAATMGELHKLREQLRRLGNRLQDSVDQVEESTIGGEIEEIEKLRINIERFEDVLEAQREIEKMQEVSKRPRPRPRSASFGVSNFPKASSNDFNSPSLEPDRVTDTKMTLTGKGKTTPMEGIQRGKPSESPSNHAPILDPQGGKGTRIE